MPRNITTRVLAASDSSRMRNELVALYNHLSVDPAPVTPAQLEAALACPNVCVIGAYERARIVGMGTVAIIPLLNKTISTIQDVVVDRQHRGKRIGPRIVRELLVIACARGAQFCDLTSHPDREAANEMYQRLGFEQRGTNAYRFVFQ